MGNKELRRVYLWKCQKCGLDFHLFSKREPRGPCVACGDRGVKSYEGEDTIAIKGRSPREVGE